MCKKTYNYVIVGAGLYGAVFGHLLKKNGNRCLVIDKRSHTGGNLYCENIEGINIHKYGPHIFHTSNKEIWDFVNSFVHFNNFIYSPLAFYKGQLYNLPFNMSTFYQMWKTVTPDQAREKINDQIRLFGVDNPKNLEEHALNIIGFDLYNTLVKGYTEKQWGREAKELPVAIIKRLPLRFTFNNNYFNDPYQGIPIGGYNILINKLLLGIEVKLNTDFFENKEYFESISEKILYTGRMDQFFNYTFGKLEYRSLRFEKEILDIDNYQGNAAVNYTEKHVPYTRIIEHKHFEFGNQKHTVITKEYPAEFNLDNEPYYPINNIHNNSIYSKYEEIASLQNKYLFGGRLGNYQYYDMDTTIEVAFTQALQEIEKLKIN